MDAYVFVVDATEQAVAAALALVPDTARAVLPMPGEERELYVAVSDTSATNLLTKIADVVTIEGLTSPTTYLAYGSSTTAAPFPTHGAVLDLVGFALLTTTATATVSVYEAALAVTGVIGAAMVSGGVNVIVEASADDTTSLDSILTSVGNLTGVVTSVKCRGAVSGGAGFTPA